MFRQADLGRETIVLVRERLFAGGRSAECPGGFVWRPGDREQRVWAEPVGGPGEPPAWRVHVETDFLRGFDARPAQLAALAIEMPWVSLGGLVRDRQDAARLQLASTAVVHGASVDWVPPVLATAARLQAAEVARYSRASGLLAVGAEPDVGEAADGGGGAAPDGFIDQIARRPLASAATVWGGRDMLEAVYALRSLAHARAVATPYGVTASFRVAGGLAELEMKAPTQGAGLGYGLSLLVTLPDEGGVREALGHNERERDGCFGTDLLGGWSPRDGRLAFAAFWPNVAYSEGAAARLAVDAARRAQAASAA